MPDVWDLTDKERGDHVLVALTPQECEAALVYLPANVRSESPHPTRVAALAAREEIRRSLRDQKGIEA